MLAALVYLLGGLVAAALFTAWAGAPTRRRGRVVYGSALVVAAAIYLGFALARGAEWGARVDETIGLLLFGALAAAGVARYPWLLAGGWLLHVLWDIVVHPLGTPTYAPEWYRWACLGFDLLVAGRIAAGLRRDSPADE